MGLVFPEKLWSRLPHIAIFQPIRVLLDFRYRTHPVPFERRKTVHGYLVSGHTRDYIQRRLFVFGDWEPWLSAWLLGHLRPGDVFVDVGANVGHFTITAARTVGPQGQVFAFEASPSMVQQLRENVLMNALANVSISQSVVSDSPGSTHVFRGPVDNLGASSTVWTSAHSDEGVVSKVLLDDAIPAEVLPLVRAIKIDVEGDEFLVLRGAKGILAAASPGLAVIAEVSPERLADRGSSSQELMELMADLGFSAFAVPNDYSTIGMLRPSRRAILEPVHAPPRTQVDVLFLKETSSGVSNKGRM